QLLPARDGTCTLVVRKECKATDVLACRHSAWPSRHWPGFRPKGHWPAPKFRKYHGAEQRLTSVLWAPQLSGPAPPLAVAAARSEQTPRMKRPGLPPVR